MMMIATHPMLSNARLIVSRSIKSMPRSRNKGLLNTVLNQHSSITIHRGMIKTIPWFFAINNDSMH
jgi:hypothetical protein